MTKAISHHLLADFSRFLSQRLGLSFTPERRSQLLKGLTSVCRDFAVADPFLCIQKLMTGELSQQQVETLAAHLTVGETYFFREKEIFDLLETHLIPTLLHVKKGRAGSSKQLGIWSAACSSGEEVYSIAIILDSYKSLLWDWQINIYATDINRKSLEFAQKGIYSEWRLRSTPPWIIDKYFYEREKKRYEIKSHIKNMVSFNYFNLVEKGCPHFLVEKEDGLDVIFCRNVLMYFTQQMASTVLYQMNRCLGAEGFLILSPTDMLNISGEKPPGLRTVGSSVFYKGDKLPPVFCSTRFSPILKSGYEGGSSQDSRKPLQEASSTSTPNGSRCAPQPIAEKQESPLTDPPDYEAAEMRYRQGQLNAAAEILHALIQCDCRQGQGQARVYGLLARVYADSGKLEQAKHWGEKAVASDQLNRDYRYLLALVHIESGNAESAVKLLKECIFLDPDFIPAYFELGMIYRRQADTRDASRCFRNALSLLQSIDPQSPVPGIADGMTAAQMMDTIATISQDKKNDNKNHDDKPHRSQQVSG